MTNEMIISILLAAIASAVFMYCIITAFYKYRMRNDMNLLSEVIECNSALRDSKAILHFLTCRLDYCEDLVKCSMIYKRAPGIHAVTHSYIMPNFWMMALLRAINFMGCELIIRVVDNNDRDKNATMSVEEERELFLEIKEKVRGWKYMNPDF